MWLVIRSKPAGNCYCSVLLADEKSGYEYEYGAVKTIHAFSFISGHYFVHEIVQCTDLINHQLYMRITSQKF